jgi:UDP-N-acetylglucosamine 2-epimerase (hydrolysing)
MRHIVFVTGTRADFGKLKPLMRRVAEHRDFTYTVFATGMHMLSRFGSTIHEIETSGFTNIFPYYNQDANATAPMEVALANTIQGLSHFVREQHPDLLVVHGDRIEPLAGAIVGALSNVLVAHIEGGELSGTVDELIRHSVSKLAHSHFVANDEAATRLVQMGETPNSVFTIGSPDIDIMLSDTLPSLDDVRSHYVIPFTDYSILLYHPVTTDLDGIAARAAALVDAVNASGHNYVVIAPNNDHGWTAIAKELRRLNDPERFRHLPSIRFEAFLTLLRNARAMVGNSSAGIREAPVYGVPTVNVGSRQANRFLHTSITDVDELDARLSTLLRDTGARSDPCHHFGDGRSGERFMNTLLTDEFWALPRQKQFLDAVAPRLAFLGPPAVASRGA